MVGKIKSAMNDSEASCVNCKHCKFSRGNGLHYYCEKKDIWMSDENAMIELDDIEYCEDYDEIEEGE
jgi:hypothetical protein